jgi:hypothetical protein
MKAIFLVLALLLMVIAWNRPPEYDEAYSIFLTAGDARPAWPSGVFHPGDVRGFYAGHAGFCQIAEDLRRGDVHPPLYFWALEVWRRVFGPSWLAARMLSVVFSIGALVVVGRIAALAGIPVLPSVLLTIGCYGFAYTGTMARGFALAQLLNVLGVALIYGTGCGGWGQQTGLLRRFAPRNDGVGAAAGGLALGAASFSNYLSVFVGLVALGWLGLRDARRFVVAAVGFALFLPADAWFFLVQRGSRVGQFQAFSLDHALPVLAKDSGAALFGGLPLYAGAAGPLVSVALGALFAVCVGAIIKGNVRDIGLFAVLAMATPVGLIALGLVFNNTPIEIRYLAFGTPFFAMLLAGSLRGRLLLVVLAVDCCAIIGLWLAPATMQPQGRAAVAVAKLAMPGALVLVPFGNDGVGIPGPFIAAAPDDLQIELIRTGITLDLRGPSRIILADIQADDASRAQTRAAMTRLAADPCWREKTAPPHLQIYTRICPPG